MAARQRCCADAIPVVELDVPRFGFVTTARAPLGRLAAAETLGGGMAGWPCIAKDLIWPPPSWTVCWTSSVHSCVTHDYIILTRPAATSYNMQTMRLLSNVGGARFAPKAGPGNRQFLRPCPRPLRAAGDVLLEIEDLHAEVAESGKKILNGVSLAINEGEVHAIFGKNGSGKSTLSKCLVGSPEYEVTSGDIRWKGKSIQGLEPEERAQLGLFLSFQSPIEIPGVSNSDFLRVSTNAVRKSRGLNELDPLEFFSFVTPKLQSLAMDPVFLNRNVNEGFSGGEKKRNEILQLACLEAQMAILDEIDSGLDIDALGGTCTRNLPPVCH